MRNLKPKYLWISPIVVAVLIPTSVALAKDMVAIEVTGPGIDGTLRVDNPNDLNRIAQSHFFDMGSQIAPLTDDELNTLAEGYQLTFFLTAAEPGQPVYQWQMFQYEMVYYPDPEGGEGYQHWLGAPDYGMPSDVWTRGSARDENLFWDILSAQGVERPYAGAAISPLQSIVTALPGWGWAALVSAPVVILAAGALIMRRRRNTQAGALGAGYN